MQGFSKVFKFSLYQQLRSGAYRFVTLAGLLLLFFVPFLGIVALERDAGGNSTDLSEETQDEYTEESEVSLSDIRSVIMVNQTDLYKGDLSCFLPASDGELTASITLSTTYEEAEKSAGEGSLIAVLNVDKADDLGFEVIAPNGSGLTSEHAILLSDYLYEHMEEVLYAGLGLSISGEENSTELVLDRPASIEDTGNEEEDMDFGREILSYVLPYLNIMLVYFLVLYYGQGVAQSCIMEKSSKLMDTFLVSIKPSAMLLGKVLAAALCAGVQFSLWIIGLYTGISLGLSRALALHDQARSGLAILLDFIMHVETGFSPAGIALGLALTAVGFLMYCSLAAVGGSLASRQEELNTTNIMFTIILVASFLLTLQSGLLNGTGSAFMWIDLVPFTSVLVTPSRVLMGNVSLLQGMISFVITLVFALLLLFAAGRIYVMMSFYKGNPPKVKEVFSMLFKGKEAIS